MINWIVCDTWNHLTLLTYVYKSYMSYIYKYKPDLALNNLQWLICHKTKPNQTKPMPNGGIQWQSTNKSKHTFGRCPWHNVYRRRKWTRRHGFKPWMRLIAFHIALICLGKLWTQLFSLQLWVNSSANYVLWPWFGNQSRGRKTLNSNLLNSA